MTTDENRTRALILAPFSLLALADLRRKLDVIYESWTDTRRLYDPEQLSARLKREGLAVLVVEADFVFEEVFEGAPPLRFLGVCRSSTHHIDVATATRHGVMVVNTPGRNAQAVAEHTLGLMLSLARRIPEASRYVTEGRLLNPTEPYLSMRGIELSGRTLGIIGLGAIGRRLASIAAAIGMECVAYDPYVGSDDGPVRMSDLDPLLSESDFVAIHAPLTAETEGLLDARRIGLMKSTAYLLSLSDPAIVVENDLVAALKNERIAGAALDVFETHPVTPNSPLLSLDNVLFTPHIGGATEETVVRHSRMMADDILRYLEGKLPEHLVNPDAWKRRD